VRRENSTCRNVGNVQQLKDRLKSLEAGTGGLTFEASHKEADRLRDLIDRSELLGDAFAAQTMSFPRVLLLTALSGVALAVLVWLMR